MRRAKRYTPKPFTHKLRQEIWKERGKPGGAGVGPAEEPHRMIENPQEHYEAEMQCKYCTRPFFFRPEVICPSCGCCQSCGIYHSNIQDTGCMCGNTLPPDAPEVIVRRVRRMK